jgi:hypothetical protein
MNADEKTLYLRSSAFICGSIDFIPARRRLPPSPESS